MAWPAVSSLRIPHQVGYWHEPGSMVSAPGTAVRSTSAPTAPSSAAASPSWCSSRLQARHRRRGPHSRGDPRIGDQQRRIDEDDLRGAECRGARPTSSPRHMRWPTSTPRRSAMSRPTEPARRWATRSRSRDCERLSVSPMMTRPGPCIGGLGQVQHRPPGVAVRHRGADQDDPLPEAQGDSRHAALHQPQPGTAPRAGARSRCAASTAPWEWDGIRARRRQLVRRGRHQCPHRPRGGAAASTGASASGPQVLRLSARTTETRERFPHHARRRAGPQGADRSRRRRVHTCRSTQREDPARRGGARPAGRGRGAAGGRKRQHLRQPNRSTPPNPLPTESFSCSPVKALSMSGWRADCTSPSRCSPSTSTRARTDSSKSWASTYGRNSSTGEFATWSGPTGRSRRSSPSNTRWGN